MKRWLRPITPIIAALFVVTACGGGTAPSAGGSTAPSASPEDKEFVFYSGGDTNVQDLHVEQILPAFEKATGIKVTFTFLEHGTGAQGIYDRIKAQKDTGKTQWDIDLWESDTGYYTRPDDLFLQVSATDIPNLAKIPKATLDFVQNKAVPYRGSSVVLAYNSDKVANPPQTYDDLLAWIKANPGKFAYNEPSTGGFGEGVVIPSVYKNSHHPKDITQPFFAAKQKDLGTAFSPLQGSAPSP